MPEANKSDLQSVTEQTDDTLGYLKHVTSGLKRLSGMRAYRSYHFRADEFGLNKNGGIQGMVKSAKARMAHIRLRQFSEIVEPAEKFVGRVLMVVTVVQELNRMGPQFDGIERSGDPTIIKDLKYARLVDMALLKAIALSATADIELALKAARWGCSRQLVTGQGGRISKMAVVIGKGADDLDSHMTDMINDVLDPAKQDRLLQRIANSIVN